MKNSNQPHFIKKTASIVLAVFYFSKIAVAQQSSTLSTLPHPAILPRPAQTPVISNDSIQRSLTALKKDLELLKKVKINGWIQAQAQFADSSGQQSYDGGNFAPNTDKRFMIRRGRFKFTYSNQLSEYVLQVNVTERGINAADVYIKVTDPWTKWITLQAGLFNRPFGFEVLQSSSDRETPERSRYTQTLLQNERDMGAALIVEAPKKSRLYGMKLTGGFFNGPGIPSNGDYNNPTKPFVNDFDSFKDFIGRLNYNKSLNDGRIKFGAGISHYHGAVRQFNNIVYTKVEKDENGTLSWKARDSTGMDLKGKGAPRIFYGADAQLSLKSLLGVTTLRAEYVYGSQPGTSSSSTSQAFEIKAATYIRSFAGYSAVFVQRIGKSKHEIAAKYSFYDPNTKVSGDQVGKPGSGLNATDIAYTDIGVGYINYFNDSIKFMLYYNFVQNELTKSISAYSKDLKDNVLTLRVQVKF